MLPHIVTEKCTFPMCFMHIGHIATPQQEFPHTYCSMVETHQPFQREKQFAFDPYIYSAKVQAKLAELQDFVHTNVTQAARNQKLHYDQHASTPSFKEGEPVWLSIPTAGKLDPRWEGEWVVKSVKSPASVEICDSKLTKVVHTNRLRHHYIPDVKDCTTHKVEDANTCAESCGRGD